MKRLREAQNVKVQPNKTGTSFMQGQSVYFKKGTSCLVDGTCNQDGILLKKGVHFDSREKLSISIILKLDRFYMSF